MRFQEISRKAEDQKGVLDVERYLLENCENGKVDKDEMFSDLHKQSRGRARQFRIISFGISTHLDARWVGRVMKSGFGYKGRSYLETDDEFASIMSAILEDRKFSSDGMVAKMSWREGVEVDVNPTIIRQLRHDVDSITISFDPLLKVTHMTVALNGVFDMLHVTRLKDGLTIYLITTSMSETLITEVIGMRLECTTSSLDEPLIFDPSNIRTDLDVFYQTGRRKYRFSHKTRFSDPQFGLACFGYSRPIFEVGYVNGILSWLVSFEVSENQFKCSIVNNLRQMISIAGKETALSDAIHNSSIGPHTFIFYSPVSNDVVSFEKCSDTAKIYIIPQYIISQFTKVMNYHHTNTMIR